MRDNITEPSASTPRMKFRTHVFVPALVLFLAGLAVTFTQTLHDVLTFNAWLVAIFAVVFGVALLLSPALGATRTRATVAVAVVSVLVGIAAPFAQSAAVLGLLLLVWASAVTIAAVWRWAHTRERDALTVGVLAALLAIVLAFGARELASVMGYFAAYCIIVGVFTGIAAFDRTAQAGESEASFA